MLLIGYYANLHLAFFIKTQQLHMTCFN